VPKPQQKPGKGSKILCAALDFIMDANVDIAMEEAAKGDTKAANDAMAEAEEAGKDYEKWGCGKSARVRSGLRCFLINSSAVADPPGPGVDTKTLTYRFNPDGRATRWLECLDEADGHRCPSARLAVPIRQRLGGLARHRYTSRLWQTGSLASSYRHRIGRAGSPTPRTPGASQCDPTRSAPGSWQRIGGGGSPPRGRSS
jgi:hypothetical protein